MKWLHSIFKVENCWEKNRWIWGKNNKLSVVFWCWLRPKTRSWWKVFFFVEVDQSKCALHKVDELIKGALIFKFIYCTYILEMKDFFYWTMTWSCLIFQRASGRKFNRKSIKKNKSFRKMQEKKIPDRLVLLLFQRTKNSKRFLKFPFFK